MIKQYKYFIGIDSGTQTGVAVYSKAQKKIIYLETMKIHKAIFLVQQQLTEKSDEIFIRVEDARQATFNRKDDAYKLRGAGSVMRDAAIWEDFLKDEHANFEMVRPKKQFTKLKPESFARITNYSGTTSQHARDAAMLVWGF